MAGLGLAILLALSGCTSVKVKLGMKVYLEKIPITSMEASLPKGPGIAPGEKLPLLVVLTRPDGKVLQTEGTGQGEVLWKDLKVSASVVTADETGTLYLPSDPRVSDGKVAHVTITVPSHPDLHTELDIPVRYDDSFLANFSGRSGTSGTSGTDGSSGTNGRSGSFDPNHPSGGGDGSRGGTGANGHDGGRGGDAPPVQVRVALRPGSRPLLQVGVSAAGREDLYMVAPQGGSLMVKADGGPGGSGGRGGRGGRGGSGGSGSPSGHSGSSGSDGRRGWSGSPGKGGSITVTYDPEAELYLGAIHLSNRGGPPPVFKKEAVAALW